MPALADSDYQLGHGLDLGAFNFAGYSNVVGDLPSQGNNSLTLDDLSLFISGHVDKVVNPFVEAEFTHLDLASSGERTGNKNGEFELERFYDDIDLLDSVTVRVGKMLAPVGEWNQIHAAPLVLATVRPAVTDRNFSEYATGISVLYSDPTTKIPDIQVYWQPSGEFSERPTDTTFHQYRDVEGAHVTFPFEALDKVGLSLQTSTDSLGVAETLYGADFNYQFQSLTLEGELTYSSLDGHGAHLARNYEWGAYLAASYAFTPKWSIFSWYEAFAERTTLSTAQDLLFGVAYHPHSAIVLKLQYLQNVGGQAINPTGVFASWSVLF